MTDLSSMNYNELKNKLVEIKEQMVRQEKIELIQSEITKLLKKHSIQFDEIDVSVFANSKEPLKKNKRKRAQKSQERKQKNDRRSVVAKKYRNPKGSETWSGRGKSPRWVVEQCDQHSITIQEFKADPRFQAT